MATLAMILAFLIAAQVAFAAEIHNVLLTPVVRNASIGELIEGQVNASSEIIFQFFPPGLKEPASESALRVFAFSNDATKMQPLIVTVRHETDVLSFSLPLRVQSDPDSIGRTFDYYYSGTNRTLCAVHSASIFVTVSSASQEDLSFRFMIYQQTSFKLSLNTVYAAMATPSAPVFYYFPFPNDTDIILLKMTSNDNLCMTLSVRNNTCPVYDMDKGVKMDGGLYQTVDNKGGITFTKEQFPLGVFVVLQVKPEASSCNNVRPQPLVTRRQQLTWDSDAKNVTLFFEKKITRTEYLIATLGALAMFVGAYVAVLMISCVLCIKTARSPNSELQGLVNAEAAPVPPYNSIEDRQPEDASDSQVEAGGDQTEPDAGLRSRRSQLESVDAINVETLSESSSVDEIDIDLLADANTDKEIFRTGIVVCVADLARKSPRVLARKSNLYHWNLITIAIFYGLPVIQLMLTYQNVSNTTGDQDLCYYNFLCAHPLGMVTDFNHIYSNLGYVLLGVLFMLITWRRDLMHAQFARQHPLWERRFGIPRHFGMYYAMGLALIMEGVLSGCYHVCPSHNNFQFDTAFMYTIAILILLKIYQTRHPDINANAYSAFGSLAFIIFVGVIGVLHGNLYFWIFFTTLHIIVCLFLSVHIYYMGRCKLNLGMFKRVWLCCYNDARSLFSGNFTALKPMYVDRMILLLVLNVANWALSGYGVAVLARQGGDFASFLLAILICNVMLYTLFYIIMKLRHGERITWQPAIYIAVSVVTWAGASYFFFNKSTTWVLTPAQSRRHNQDCQLFHFYDNHDIWHFLSAASLFLSFMILLTLDDDLDEVPRDKIPVF